MRSAAHHLSAELRTLGCARDDQPLTCSKSPCAARPNRPVVGASETGPDFETATGFEPGRSFSDAELAPIFEHWGYR